MKSQKIIVTVCLFLFLAALLWAESFTVVFFRRRGKG